MIFLTTGEKIRTLRKKFNMRQQELEDENITRAFISMIETGKRGLSKDTAKHIAFKLNKKAIELGINLNIDEEYLLRTPSEDAENYCLEKLNNNPTQDEIDVIINISRKYNLTKVEAQAYKTIGDYNFDSANYVDSFINYMVSLDLYKDTEERSLLAYIYNRLGVCKVNQFEYIEAISFFNRSNHYSILYNNKTIEGYSLYNLARTYKRLEKFDEALGFVEKYLILCSDEEDFTCYIYASVLKANCYNRKGNNDKAVSIFMELLSKLSDRAEDDYLWYVYQNLAIIYQEQDNLDKSIEFFDKAERLAEERDRKALASTQIQKARVYIKYKKYDEALRLCNKGLRLAIDYNDIDVILNGYYSLIDIYTDLGDFNSLKTNYIKLLDVIKNKEHYKDDVIKIYNRLALLYLEQNDIEMCKKYLNMAS